VPGDFYTDFAVRVDGPPERPLADRLATIYSKGFTRSERARVQTGPAQTRGTLPVREVMRRWAGGRAVVSVTDLHIRGTRVASALGIDELSDFNLLLRGSEDVACQEMMTLVISTAGNVTDSHSDDPDGSNHAFVGKKLWLAWDTFEGLAAGLEDHSREPLGRLANFDMRTFLRLRSACWFTVSAGETLFLPGKLTHKVVTLEPYLGVGSFYVALPGCLETLARWYRHGPLWSLATRANDGLVDDIARIAARRVRELRNASREERERWGLRYLEDAVVRFERGELRIPRASLLRRPAFAELVATTLENVRQRGREHAAAIA
jgi:hypothetical protein